jgi:hypothetical protein
VRHERRVSEPDERRYGLLDVLTGYALPVAKVGALPRRSSGRRLVNAIAGTMLTALGVRIAVERR